MKPTTRNPYHFWTREEVISTVRRIAEGIGHFPSSRELNQMRQSSLVFQIAKYGGFAAVSKEIGIPRVASVTETGKLGEAIISEKLSVLGYVVERMAHRYPFDLLVNGCVRVDVKTANYGDYSRSDAGRGHFFCMGKVMTCDVVILYAADDGWSYVIPWNRVPVGNVLIPKSGIGKYGCHKEDWSLVQKLICALSPIVAERAA